MGFFKKLLGAAKGAAKIAAPIVATAVGGPIAGAAVKTIERATSKPADTGAGVSVASSIHEARGQDKARMKRRYGL
jgi:hypothetical protein